MRSESVWRGSVWRGFRLLALFPFRFSPTRRTRAGASQTSGAPMVEYMAGNDDKPADDSGDDRALRARLDSLSDALDQQRRDAENRARTQKVEPPGGETGKAMSLGFRVLSEFVAGIIAGGVIGWALDKWLSTSPVFLLIFGGLGTVAGFWNVYRIAAAPTGPRDGGDDKG